jgi:5-methyltetrahydrofolate corrinoid/iron sulfur protein methyltransferase
VLLIADNLRITHRRIAQALKEENPLPIQEMVRCCEKAGADALDINSGPLTKNPRRKMKFLVEAVQAVTALPLFIDTANPVAMAAGLEAADHKAVINGFSLEPHKISAILPLAQTHDVDIIGYLLHADSQVPQNSTEKLNIAVDLFETASKFNLRPDQIIIDPIVPPLVWQQGHLKAIENLEVMQMLPELLGFPVRTIAGLSNLTTGRHHSDKKLLVEQAYLPMLAVSGLDMLLFDIFHHRTLKIAKACDQLTSDKIFSWEMLR